MSPPTSPGRRSAGRSGGGGAGAEALGWELARHPVGLAVTTYVTTDVPGEALVGLQREVAAWLAGQRVTGAVLAGRWQDEDLAEAEGLAPDVPELAGASDAAELLGISRQ